MPKSFYDKFAAASAREFSRQSRQRRRSGGGGGGGGGCLLFFNSYTYCVLVYTLKLTLIF